MSARSHALTPRIKPHPRFLHFKFNDCNKDFLSRFAKLSKAHSLDHLDLKLDVSPNADDSILILIKTLRNIRLKTSLSIRIEYCGSLRSSISEKTFTSLVQSIYKHTKLTKLLLSFEKVHLGDFNSSYYLKKLSTLPPKLPNLESLTLYMAPGYSESVLEDVQLFERALPYLKKLKNLYLSMPCLYSYCLANGIKELTSLERLKVNVYWEKVEFARVFAGHKALKSLDLDLYSKFESDFVRRLKDLYRQTPLRDLSELRLNLNCNARMSQKNFTDMVSDVGNLVNLTTLQIDLKGDMLKKDSLHRIGGLFNSLRKLKRFSLNYSGSNNDYDTDAMTKFMRDMPVGLEWLQLICNNNGNAFSDECLIALSRYLERNAFLVLLEISCSHSNTLQNQSLLLLANSLCKVKRLEKLQINFSGSDNKIENSGICKLLSSVKNIRSLTSLGLEFKCKQLVIDDETCLDLAKSLGRLKGLTELKLMVGGVANKVGKRGLVGLYRALAGITEMEKMQLDLSIQPASFLEFLRQKNRVYTREFERRSIAWRRLRELEMYFETWGHHFVRHCFHIPCTVIKIYVAAM